MENFVTEMQAKSHGTSRYNPFLCYSTVVIQDGELDELYEELEQPLKEFYDNGGSVIILGEIGIFALPARLGATFECDWKWGTYNRYEMRATDAANSLMSNSSLRDKIATVPYSKHNFLSVPDVDAMFYPISEEGSQPKFTPFASHSMQCGKLCKRLTYISSCNPSIQFFILFKHLLKEHVTSIEHTATFTMVPTTATVGHILEESIITQKAEQNGYHYAGRDIGTHMIAFEKGSTRLNFWLSTGTVGSYIVHPKHPNKRRTQLFRRDVDHNGALEIIKNPRIHTGKGYAVKTKEYKE